MPNPWDNDPIVSQDSPFGSRPVIHEAPPHATPQTPEQRAGTIANTQRSIATLPFDIRKSKADAVKAEIEAQNAQRKAAVEKAAFREPVDSILGVIDAAANAHRMTRQGGPSSDPWGRVVTQKIPGTKAHDISGYLDTIGANTAFEKLSQMRQESPTGGAVGNVSDKDLQLLKSTIASLDPGQSTGKFQKDLATVLKSYQKVLYKLPGGKEAYHNWREQWLGRAKPKQQAGGFQFLGFEQ